MATGDEPINKRARFSTDVESVEQTVKAASLVDLKVHNMTV